MGTYIEANADIPLFRHMLARAADKPTSKAAAVNADAFVGGHEAKILAALEVGPGTKDQIASRCGLTEQQVIRRMHKLEADGKVVAVGEDTSPSGCRETVYSARTAFTVTSSGRMHT